MTTKAKNQQKQMKPERIYPSSESERMGMLMSDMTTELRLSRSLMLKVA